MDVEGQIKPGDDFVKVLNDQVAQCDVLLAIIGEGWVGARDSKGSRRLEKEDDFVRIEIASALRQGKRVISVPVNQAEMPRADQLPTSLKLLARRNAVAIRPTRFKADSQGLVKALKDALAAADLEKAAKTEAERKAAEEERQRREAEEEARAAQVEAAAKARAQARLTPEEIRKAEELANWDFIKDSTNAAEFRDHIARFEGGPTERYARKKLEGLLWADPATRASIEALRKFLEEFPKGDHATQAHADLAMLEVEAEKARQAEERRRTELEAWARVAGSIQIADFEAFLTQWPNGKHANDARARIRELRGSLFSRRGALKGFGIGAAATATGGGLLYSAVTPGEWLWRQIHDQSIRTFTGHTKQVNSVAFSPDGGGALSGSRDNTLKLWDLATGKEIRTFTGHGSLDAFQSRDTGVNSVAFSPDGHMALSGSHDKTLKLWDLAAGKEIRTFTGHAHSVNSVAISPNGRTALSGSDDHTLKLWDLATGKEIRTFTGHADVVNSVAFSPDGHMALSGSHDKTLKLWDLAAGKEIRTFTGHAHSVNSVAISPDGRTALSGSADQTLKLWDLATGKEIEDLHRACGRGGLGLPLPRWPYRLVRRR